MGGKLARYAIDSVTIFFFLDLHFPIFSCCICSQMLVFLLVTIYFYPVSKWAVTPLCEISFYFKHLILT